MNTKIISMICRKGGVGKTTIGFNLASLLTLDGYKVLVVDNDSQANMSFCSGIKADRTLMDSLIEFHKNNHAQLPFFKTSEGWDIVPSDRTLENADSMFAEDTMRGFMLKRLLSEVQPQYDFIIIDCPPALAMGTNSALLASDYVIIIAEPSSLSGIGIQQTIEAIERIKPYNADLSPIGILLNRWRGTKLNIIVRGQISAVYPELIFRTVIRENTSLSEALTMKKSIFTYQRQAIGAIDLNGFYFELKSRIRI